MRYQLAGIQHIEFFEGQEDEAFKSMLVSLSRLGVSTGETETKQDPPPEIVPEDQSTATNAPVSTGRKGGPCNRPSGTGSHWPCFGAGPAP